MSYQRGVHKQTGVLEFRAFGSSIAFIKFEFDAAYNPVCSILAKLPETRKSKEQTERFWGLFAIDDYDWSHFYGFSTVPMI